MKISEIINGFNFQSIANHVIDVDSAFHTRNYSNYDIIYCKTDLLPLLFQEIRESLFKFILVTHQSDYEISESLFNSRPASVKKWFAQNANFEHPDLIPVPIGLENHAGPSKGQFTDFNFLDSLNLEDRIDKIQDKIYCNFNLSTHHNRSNVLNILSEKNLAFIDNKKPFRDYWKTASEYRFIASPRGNGIDCHRTWETLMMGGIPIVEKHLIYNSFTNLPIIQIQKWDDISIDKLIEETDKLNISVTNERIFVSHWRAIIKNYQREL